MQALSRALVNGVLSFAVSVTMVLTVADRSQGAWDRTDLALAAGISGFLSGICTSYFGGNLRRVQRKYL